MERLTKREGKHTIRIGNEWRRHDVGWDKLAEYEDLEEKGLLLELKLKVGDEFWELNDNFLEPAVYPRKAHSLQHVLYCMDRLGKVTFLTKEEAEKRLVDIKNERRKV